MPVPVPVTDEPTPRVGGAGRRSFDGRHYRRILLSVFELTAYDTRVVGAINGEVDYVSADRLTDPMNRSEYFLVRIRLLGETGDTVQKLKIKPGMPVDAQITLAGRTPLDHLITPLKRSNLKAFIQE